MMTSGARGVVWMDTPRTLVWLSKIIFSQEHQTPWVAPVCHGVAYVRYMGIDTKTIATCRRWLRRQKVCVSPFVIQWGPKINIAELMACFKRKHMIHTLWKERIPTWSNSCSLSCRWCNQHPRCSIHHLCKCILFWRYRSNSSHHSHSSHHNRSL